MVVNLSILKLFVRTIICSKNMNCDKRQLYALVSDATYWFTNQIIYSCFNEYEINSFHESKLTLETTNVFSNLMFFSELIMRLWCDTYWNQWTTWNKQNMTKWKFFGNILMRFLFFTLHLFKSSNCYRLHMCKTLSLENSLTINILHG